MEKFGNEKDALKHYEEKFKNRIDFEVCEIGGERAIVAATPMAIDEFALRHIVEAFNEVNGLLEDSDVVDNYIIDCTDDVIKNFLEMFRECIDVKVVYVSDEY